MRQRLTIFNPGTSNDDIVQDITHHHVHLQNTSGFQLENRVRLNTSVHAPLVGSIRVQQVIDSPGPVFNYHYSHGFHIYAVPNVESIEQKDAFYDQTLQLLADNFNITLDRDQFVETANSVYYHTLDEHEWVAPTEIYHGKTFEWVWTPTTVTFKEVITLGDELTVQARKGVTTEMGLFILDKITTPDDLLLSGLRVELGTDAEKHVHKTMFHVKPRHRAALGSAMSSITPNGLHPVLNTSIENGNGPQVHIADDNLAENCKFYYYIDLSKHFIFDKYQSVPQNASLAVESGHSDLELPEYRVHQWGSEILFEFDEAPSEIDFTLHSRYQKPGNGESVARANAAPRLFYACDQTKDAYLLSTSPFDNKLEFGGNYEAYFTNDTVFYHFKNNVSQVTASIPRANGTFANAEFWTGTALLIGLTYVLIRMIGGKKKVE